MITVLDPPGSLIRTHDRGRLLSILEKETLLSRLRVAHNGHFDVETIEWHAPDLLGERIW